MMANETELVAPLIDLAKDHVILMVVRTSVGRTKIDILIGKRNKY